MLRTKALPLLAAAVAIPGSIAVAGCGGSDDNANSGGDNGNSATNSAVVDPAQAASATASKGTAKLKIKISMSGAGLPKPIELEANGVTDLKQPRLQLTMNFDKLIESLGQKVDGNTDTTIKVDGKNVWVKIPQVKGAQLPQGKQWVSVDLEQILKALNVDGAGLSKVFRADPASQIQALTATKSLKKVGTEELNGTSVTHFSGQISAREIIDSLPADQKDAVTKSLEQLEKSGSSAGAGQAEVDKMLDQKSPIDLWIDGENVVHRQTMTQEIPATNGSQPGTVKMDYQLSDFGAALDVSPPPADQTLDVTQMLTQAVGGLGSAASGGAATVPAPTATTP